MAFAIRKVGRDDRLQLKSRRHSTDGHRTSRLRVPALSLFDIPIGANNHRPLLPLRHPLLHHFMDTFLLPPGLLTNRNLGPFFNPPQITRPSCIDLAGALGSSDGSSVWRDRGDHSLSSLRCGRFPDADLGAVCLGSDIGYGCVAGRVFINGAYYFVKGGKIDRVESGRRTSAARVEVGNCSTNYMPTTLRTFRLDPRASGDNHWRFRSLSNPTNSRFGFRLQWHSNTTLLQGHSATP